VGLLPDQVPPEGMGVWAPFFGQPAYTMTLAARLVQQTGAAWLLIWGERLPRGAGYVVRVQCRWPSRPTRGEQAAPPPPSTARWRPDPPMPAQYLWGYHRYKAPRAAAESA
jgi:KDO2-lipid IV(A) lauroyltransferase